MDSKTRFQLYAMLGLLAFIAAVVLTKGLALLVAGVAMIAGAFWIIAGLFFEDLK
jgi:hypothetical protein